MNYPLIFELVNVFKEFNSTTARISNYKLPKNDNSVVNIYWILLYKIRMTPQYHNCGIIAIYDIANNCKFDI